MKFISTLLIIMSLISFSAIAEQKNNALQKVKIRKLDHTLRVPADVPFFDAENNKYYFEDFDGKTVVLAFWATWCAPCIKELPELDTLKKDFRKLPVEIIALSEDFQGPQLVKDFYNENDIKHLKIYHDYGNSLFRALNVAGLPTTFIIDPDGVIKMVMEGSVRWNDEEIRKILLEHIGGNPVMPKNSSNNDSLNQTVKTPLKKDDEKNKAISPLYKASALGEVKNNSEVKDEEANNSDDNKHNKIIKDKNTGK